MIRRLSPQVRPSPTAPRGLVPVLVGALLGAVGCAGDSTPDPLSPEARFETSSAAICAGNCNSTFVSNTLPASMAPGERVNVQVVARNTGTANWDTTNYALYRQAPVVWSWTQTNLVPTVAPNATATFNFVITAPSTTGNTQFNARLVELGNTFFGPTFNATINVTNQTRQWACSLVSHTVPTTMTPGTTYPVTVTVQNSGTQTWPASGFSLHSRDTPTSLWNNTISNLTSAVAPNGTTTFSFNIRAPATAGTYTFRRQIFDSRAGVGVGFFDLTNDCLNVPNIAVGGAAALNAAEVVASRNVPAVLAPGEIREVTLVLENTGTQTWTSGGTYQLVSQSAPASLWGVTARPVSSNVAAGQQSTFTFAITAPNVAGSYNFRWRMLEGASNFFGSTIDVPITVDAGATPQLSATVVSQVIPNPMTPGGNFNFVITIQNSGSLAWNGSNFRLSSRNSPSALWGATTFVALGAAETVAPGASRVFTIPVTAPATRGYYTSAWQMFQNGGVGFFGATATTNNVQSGSCGNRITETGETCDDGNIVSGDGCSSLCVAEPRSVDLAAAPADRTVFASTSNKQMGNVAIADFNNDGIDDVAVGENANFIPTGQQGRSNAGRVYVYFGSAGFFNGSSVTAPTGAPVVIWGAETNDNLGGSLRGRIKAGDVTGDGIPDIVVAAPDADGIGNALNGAGEVYVIRGGSTLTSTTIDLRRRSTALVARVIGAAAADSLSVLDVGDVNGDNIADILLGATGNDTNGNNAGAAYVLAGGGTLTGTISLSTATPLARIYGPSADAQLGASGAIGNFGGSAIGDVVVGASSLSRAPLSRNGGAFGFFGPLSGTYDTGASQFSISVFGQTNNDNLGSAVAIGNVRGSTVSELVIGSPQARRGATQYGALLVFNGPVAAGTYDLAAGAVANTVIQAVDPNDNLGNAIGLGDFNGDGYADFACLAGLGDGPTNIVNAQRGELSIILGAATLPATISLATANASSPQIVFGAANNDYLGLYNGTIAFGDPNDDGRADVCVGSYQGGPLRGGRLDCFRSRL
jgi:cysteine-rich repeat protein